MIAAPIARDDSSIIAPPMCSSENDGSARLFDRSEQHGRKDSHDLAIAASRDTRHPAQRPARVAHRSRRLVRRARRDPRGVPRGGGRSDDSRRPRDEPARSRRAHVVRARGVRVREGPRRTLSRAARARSRVGADARRDAVLPREHTEVEGTLDGRQPPRGRGRVRAFVRDRGTPCAGGAREARASDARERRASDRLLGAIEGEAAAHPRQRSRRVRPPRDLREGERCSALALLRGAGRARGPRHALLGRPPRASGDSDEREGEEVGLAAAARSLVLGRWARAGGAGDGRA